MVTKKELSDRESLIKELACLNNFKDNVDAATFAFSLLCVSSIYKIQNPYDIVEKDIKLTHEMREPRAFLYYVLWCNTGRTHKQLNELCGASDPTLICRMINSIKASVKNIHSDMAINASNINKRVVKFKEVLKTELTNG